MKKYIYGITALATAVILSSFTITTKKVTDTKVFEFDGSGAYQSQSQMQDKTNWIYIGLLADVGLCGEVNDAKGCRFVVDQAQLSSTPSLGNTFASVSTGFTITVNQISSPFWRVQSVTKSGYTGTVSNQPLSFF